MATTGYRLAGLSANVTGVWDNLGNVLIKDDAVTSFTTSTKNNTRTFRAYNFGFDGVIPAGATIDQVNLQIRSARTNGGSIEVRARINGTDGASLGNINNASLTTIEFTAIARPGGGTWTRADLLDGVFEARFDGLHPNNTTSRTYECAWIEVEVVYTEAAGTYTGEGAGTLAAVTGEAAATFTPPVYTGTGEGTLAAITGEATATFSPTFTGAAEGTLAAVTGTATAEFTMPVFTGTGAGTLAPVVGEATATFEANELPTVALNVPADLATGVSVTPTFTFTGTDPNTGDLLEYQIQVDLVDTFDSQT